MPLKIKTNPAFEIGPTSSFTMRITITFQESLFVSSLYLSLPLSLCIYIYIYIYMMLKCVIVSN